MEATEHAPAHMLPESEWTKHGHSVPAGFKVTVRTPPCECDVCQSQYRTATRQRFDEFSYVATFDDKAASNILTMRVTQMKEDRDYIRNELQLHGDAILDWWRRRRPTGRLAFLREITPSLADAKETQADYQCERFMRGKRPTFDSTITLVEKAADRKRNRAHFLLPYKNIPALASNALAVPGLLYARANSTFEEWASFDNEQLTVNWNCGFFDVFFNSNAVKVCGPEYGQITNWEKSAAHRGDIIGFPRAHLLIEAQARLFHILKEVVAQGLCRIAQDSTGGMKQLIFQMCVTQTSTQEQATWASYVHRPFQLPPHFDLDLLKSEVQMRCNDVADHLWLLQIEPAYLRRYLRLVNEVIVAEIKVIVEIYWFWQGILVELGHVKGICHSFRDSVRPGMTLPPKVDKALGGLDALLVQIINLRARQIRLLMHERPAFYEMYDHTYDNETGGALHSLKDTATKPDKATEYKTHRLWWCLGNLLGDPDTPSRLPYSMLLEMLDDHLKSADINERRKLDEVLYEKLADYATMLELFEVLRLHRPNYTRRTAEDCKQNEDRSGWRRVKQFSADLGSTINVLSALETFEHIMPPSGGKGRQWLKRFEASHTALQAFWASLHCIYTTWHKRCGFSNEDTTEALCALQHWKNEDYRVRLRQKRQEVLSNIMRPTTSVEDDAFLPMASIIKTSTACVKQLPKQKTKSQGPGQEFATEDSQPTLEPEVPSTTILLPKRALAMFHRMFPETVQERSGEIDWAGFISSMGEAGFLARNGGGSIVIFEQTCGSGKIIFHRSHPAAKIDAVMLQSMGRRMNKWFGWTRDTFLLASKVESADCM